MFVPGPKGLGADKSISNRERKPKMKKILSIALALVMVFALVGVAQAAEFK